MGIYEIVMTFVLFGGCSAFCVHSIISTVRFRIKCRKELKTAEADVEIRPLRVPSVKDIERLKLLTGLLDSDGKNAELKKAVDSSLADTQKLREIKKSAQNEFVQTITAVSPVSGKTEHRVKYLSCNGDAPECGKYTDVVYFLPDDNTPYTADEISEKKRFSLIMILGALICVPFSILIIAAVIMNAFEH